MNIAAYTRQKRQLSAAQAAYDNMSDPKYEEPEYEWDESEGEPEEDFTDIDYMLGEIKEG